MDMLIPAKIVIVTEDEVGCVDLVRIEDGWECQKCGKDGLACEMGGHECESA